MQYPHTSIKFAFVLDLKKSKDLCIHLKCEGATCRYDALEGGIPYVFGHLAFPMNESVSNFLLRLRWVSCVTAQIYQEVEIIVKCFACFGHSNDKVSALWSATKFKGLITIMLSIYR